MTTLLTSRLVRERYGHLLGGDGAAVQWIVYDPDAGASIPDSALERVEAAYLSTDILGTSSKTDLTLPMREFCDLLRRARNLKWVQVPSSGLDRPIHKELAAKGVRLTNTAGLAAETVALTALTGLLALSRRMLLWIEGQRDRTWNPLRLDEREPVELRGQRVLIVGTGSIGRELARLCQAVGLVTHGLRRSVSGPMPHFDEVGPISGLDDALPRADWIVLACPLTDDTKHLLNKRRFDLFKPGAQLINVARGEVVAEQDLIEALRDGRVAGAYLDVVEKEPLDPSSPLWDMKNVLISPHSAGDSTGRHGRIAELFFDNLRRLREGEPLVNEARPT
ncbi:D-2-hydroxyacid dehydrogenase [Bordetella sp. 2513F-2]